MVFKKSKTIYLIGMLVMCLFSACVDDNYDFNNLDATIEVDTKLVAPLVYSKVQLNDLLADSLDGLGLQLRDSTIYIVHRDSQYMGNELINQLKVLPQGEFTFQIMVGEELPIEIYRGDISHNVDFTFEGINTNPNERLDSILMGECYANLAIHTKHLIPIEDSYMDIHFMENELLLDPQKYPDNTVRIPLAKAPEDADEPVVITGEDEVDVTEIIDLRGAKLNFRSQSEDKNTFHVELVGHIVSAVPFESGTEIDLKISMDELVPHLTYLHIGTERDIYENDLVIDFDYTQEFQQTDAFLPFYNPEILMTCINNIGVPVRYYIDYVEAMDTRTGESVLADFNGSSSMSIVVNTPSFQDIEGLTNEELLSFDVSQLVRYSEVTFDREFGHTDRLFKINPNKLRYHYRIRSIDEDPNGVHYFFHDSDMKLAEEATMQLSFEGDAENPDKNFFISKTDSVPFLEEPVDMGNISFNEATKCELRLSYKNFLPVGVTGSIAYLDAQDNRILTEAEQSFKIVAGKVDANGFVIESTDAQDAISIAFEYGQVKTLLTQVKTLLFSYKMANDEQKTITLRTNDWLELKANMYFDGSLVLDLNNNGGN